jgi:uncharacterized protein YndB with AHSA1/START domain
MITAKTDAAVLEIKKTLKAPVEQVCSAWTEPEQISKWFGCDGATNKQISQDFRVGGDYKFEIFNPDGKPITMYGSFKEIVPNRKLVYSWNNNSVEFPANDTLVTVEFIGKGDTTEIILSHSKFVKAETVQGHSMGWTAALEKFAALLG